MSAVLWLVVPCYNESDTLPSSAPVMLDKLDGFIRCGRISEESRILFVNDGSSDDTWDVICGLHEKDPRLCGISLSHNAGEQNACLAGMFTAVKYADAVITMGCDLQDDVNALDGMLDRYDEGCEIVFGVRKKRETDTAFKKLTAEIYYKLMKRMLPDFVEEHSMFRLMSRRAVEMLGGYGERNIHLPTLVLQLGLKSDSVLYERNERVAGTTKYPLKKMFAFALNAVTASTSAPLALITVFGCLSLLLFIACAAALIVNSVKTEAFNVPLAVLSVVWLISAGLAFSLRILGEYICKTALETKHRPRYHIIETLIK